MERAGRDRGPQKSPVRAECSSRTRRRPNEQSNSQTAPAGPNSIIELQRVAGNRLVNRVLSGEVAVGRVDDPAEVDADRQAHGAISRLPGGGEGLSASHAVTAIGGALGMDASRVRVHRDAHAAGLARQLGARAFTHGNEVFLGADRSDPATAEGRTLLAHELAHVAQNSKSGSENRPGGLPTIRRKVGFEFEDPHWRPWRHQTDPNGDQVEPVKRKKSIHVGTNWKLEADDTPGPKMSNLEFVTEPFEETTAGIRAFEVTMAEIQAVHDRLTPVAGRPGPGSDDALKAGQPPYPYQAQLAAPLPPQPSNPTRAWNASAGALPGIGKYLRVQVPVQGPASENYVQPADHQLSGGDVAAADTRLSGGKANGFRFKMQATFGATLATLPGVMETFGAPSQSTDADESARREPAMQSLVPDGDESLNYKIIAAAPAAARVVLAKLKTQSRRLGAQPGGEPDGTLFNNANDVLGFLSATIFTLSCLAQPVMVDAWKYRLTLMPRSSYAAMFSGIANRTQRKWLKTNIDVAIDEIVDAINNARLTPSAVKVDSPVFVAPSDNSIRADIMNKKFDDQLPQDTDATAMLNSEKALYATLAGVATVDTWLRGITVGTDLLVPSTLDQVLRTDGASRAERRAVKERMESFMPRPTRAGDTRAGTGEHMAIFEHRGIAPMGSGYAGAVDIALDVAHERALRILQYMSAVRSQPELGGRAEWPT
jgi:hypothetical protein